MQGEVEEERDMTGSLHSLSTRGLKLALKINGSQLHIRTDHRQTDRQI